MKEIVGHEKVCKVKDLPEKSGLEKFKYGVIIADYQFDASTSHPLNQSINQSLARGGTVLTAQCLGFVGISSLDLELFQSLTKTLTYVRLWAPPPAFSSISYLRQKNM